MFVVKSNKSIVKGIGMKHPFEPIYDDNSKILILGSFPSVRSREEGFFYGHPQNRFWKVTAAVFRTDVPQTIDEKRRFLFEHGIALWDVIASCDVKNSSDGNIRNTLPNDLSCIFETARIEKIFTNGRLAQGFYEKHMGKGAIYLPSTSPANAAWTLEKLISAWKVIADHTLDINSSM